MENQSKKSPIQTIYKPKPKAAAFSPYAANITNGCSHGCLYCYQKKLNITYKKRPDFNLVEQKPDFFEHMEKAAMKHRGKEQILCSFATDLYTPENQIWQNSRKVLSISYKSECCLCILTKSPDVVKDWDLIQPFGEHFAISTTLTCDNDKSSKIFEPNAGLPQERIEMLKFFHTKRLEGSYKGKIWVSLEPCLIPAQTFSMIVRSYTYVDGFKVGKLNGFKHPDIPAVNWFDYAREVITLLRSLNVKFIVKEDMIKYCVGLNLTADELNQRLLDVPPFQL